MLPSNSWLFDLEILNAIPDKTGYRIPGIRYCKHWGDHAGMGISCLALFRPDFSEVKVFTSDFCPTDRENPRPLDPQHISLFAAVVKECDMLIGYNSRMFDAKVLAALGIHIPPWKHLDILAEIKKKIRQAAPKGYKMSDLSRRCGGPDKTEDGALAPIYWQRGDKDRVIAYCLNDLRMLGAIVHHYRLNMGAIPGPDNERVELRLPHQISTEDRI